MNSDETGKPTIAQPMITESDAELPNSTNRPLRKTPMYTAVNSPRYHRQRLIRELEDRTKRTLLCYICGRGAEIEKDDVVGIVELLHNVDRGNSIDLMLHTLGGDVDAAEKLIGMVRCAVATPAALRVIIPDCAKSAGTLMALGADEIVMSDSSELGTIDPQIWLKESKGNDICHSVLNYLDAYAHVADNLRNAPNDPVWQVMISNFDPTVLRKFEAVRDRARTLAENLLKRRGLNYSSITSDLMDTKRFPSHSQMIGYETAKEIGLSIKYLPSEDFDWQQYWELYCLLRLATKDRQKLFESSRASLPLDS